MSLLIFMNINLLKKSSTALLVLASAVLTACSSGSDTSARPAKPSKILSRSHTHLVNPIETVERLDQQQQAWKGTRYRLGGNSKRGIDCSGFTQITFKELFGISLPRMTIEQAKVGKKVAKSDLKAGDLVFFNTGRGPNGKHVGIYMENGRFLHASTKGGVIYSDMNSPYWSKTFWQGRRL